MYNPFSLEGKTILVTGASSGIGRTTAIECSKMGANLCIVGRNIERLNETFSQLFGDSANHKQFVLELTDYEKVEAAIKDMPTFDGVVNSAGISTTILFQFLTRDKIQHVFDVNFFSPIELTRLLIKKKKLQRELLLCFCPLLMGQ